MALIPVASATTYAVVPTVLGDLTVVRHDGAVAGLYYPGHPDAPGRVRFGARDDSGVEGVAAQIVGDLAGRRRTFTFPVALAGDPLQTRVWEALAEVTYGSATTCEALASRLGGGVTPRQVGAALARDPVCLIVPCHRVVGQDGTPVGYAGGQDRDERVLAIERHTATVAYSAELSAAGIRIGASSAAPPGL